MSKRLRSKLEQQLNTAWYGAEPSVLSKVLKPLSTVYRRGLQLSKPQQRDVYESPLPVIVVGNIVVGGAGKTPLVIAVCEKLLEAGHRPAILTRGYGSSIERFPHMVAERDGASDVGDEPKLLHSRLGVPVCVDPERSRAARYLLARKLCDVIVLDDGLQHRKLARDIEIAVVDGSRLLGNGLCLPAGPLREPANRLERVDFVLMNGEPDESAYQNSGIKHYDAVMSLQVEGLVNLLSAEVLTVDEFLPRVAQRTPLALCGIANPSRFFQTLKNEGLDCVPRAFPDHYAFAPGDLRAAPDQAVIMTEKDAVKCRDVIAHLGLDDSAARNFWYLRVGAQLPKEFNSAFMAKCSQVFKQHTESVRS